ncbi:necrosis inducing protein-domain-containing protein [Fusarium redolens]|uniref:Necrosis inducing protein-domain-containing protein n=1 Tax=Fusarium redolens TaxID=48865 RepID=A0A9P9FW14_FUSRE|nr:necrosis inducing protein-domain-containing protein [Fusarium redolens]KAH7207775.1 necrosis inducing protein-domain-containing protein [Fusarium redolens]
MRTSYLGSALLAIAEVVLAYSSPILRDNDVFRRDVLTKLPRNADENSLRFQPALDFDKDSCYNTAAVDVQGNLNPGLPNKGSPSAGCRDISRLDNANVYSRSRCNNGWCAYITGRGTGGHVHDWENVVVFVQNNKRIARVAPSAHGEYKGATNNPVLDGDHPLIVYHKNGLSTHAFRIAKEEERYDVENDFGWWQIADLVAWDGYPSGFVQEQLTHHDFGKATIKLVDSRFGDNLKKAAGDSIPGFDPYQG